LQSQLIFHAFNFNTYFFVIQAHRVARRRRRTAGTGSSKLRARCPASGTVEQSRWAVDSIVTTDRPRWQHLPWPRRSCSCRAPVTQQNSTSLVDNSHSSRS